MEDKKKILIINAHLKYPNWTEGALNNSFQQVAKDFFQSKDYEIIETRIEDEYSIEDEVEKHLESDIVILQMPVNWFGAPWIYKKYADEVFNAGLQTQKFLSGDGRTREDTKKQYGSGGKMQGRKFMICATFNAPEEAFNNPEQNLLQGKSSADLFLNITSNYRFCGYEIVSEYNCYDIFKRDDIAKDLQNYPLHLEKLLQS